jgi:hypothetical protein
VFTVGPTFFAASGDHPEGDGLTRFQTTFAGGSSADVSSFANGSGTNTGGTLTAGQYEVVVDSLSEKGLAYGVDTDLGRAINTAYTWECFFNSATISQVDTTTAMITLRLKDSPGYIQLLVNAFSNPVYYFDELNGVFTYTGGVPFLAISTDHHFAICVDAAGDYNTYLDGVRIAGPRNLGNIAHINGNFLLGGSRAGGTGQLRLRFKGVRIRRAVMYTGASFTPPASVADWGPP